MNVSVFGLGYVGCVSAACLARNGHLVVGVDINPQKVEKIEQGCSPVLEPGLAKMLGEAVCSGRLRATVDGRQAVQQTEVSLICVGTPGNGNGSLHTRFLENVCREIGQAMEQKQGYHVVAIRSTVLPGTTETRLIPLLEAHSSRKAGPDFGVCVNPEFLREGNAIEDFCSPSHVVVGELDAPSGDAVARIYLGLHAPVIHTSMRTAEMLKYANNAFHALKITFANEIGNLCKALGADGQMVMEIFRQDRRLNISTAYLTPGFGFGGSCLPKDLRALLYEAKEKDVNCPVLRAVLESNQEQIQRAVELVEQTGYKKIGVLGLTFKPGTDDVRESPIVTLVETLLGRGYELGVYDTQVDLDRLVGANKYFLERALPHIARIMRRSMGEVIAASEVVVVANGNADFGDVPSLLRKDQVLVDLAGVARPRGKTRAAYEGICW